MKTNAKKIPTWSQQQIADRLILQQAIILDVLFAKSKVVPPERRSHNYKQSIKPMPEHVMQQKH